MDVFKSNPHHVRTRAPTTPHFQSHPAAADASSPATSAGRIRGGACGDHFENGRLERLLCQLASDAAVLNWRARCLLNRKIRGSPADGSSLEPLLRRSWRDTPGRFAGPFAL